MLVNSLSSKSEAWLNTMLQVAVADGKENLSSAIVSALAMKRNITRAS